MKEHFRLRYLYSDQSTHTWLIDRIGNRCSFAGWSTYSEHAIIIVLKAINNYPPEYLRGLFKLSENVKKPESC